MKCPLHYLVTGHTEKGQVVDFFQCIKEECAWWSKSCKMCSITALASDIGFLAGTLNNIETKMPHEKQFRR